VVFQKNKVSHIPGYPNSLGVAPQEQSGEESTAILQNDGFFYF